MICWCHPAPNLDCRASPSQLSTRTSLLEIKGGHPRSILSRRTVPAPVHQAPPPHVVEPKSGRPPASPRASQTPQAPAPGKDRPVPMAIRAQQSRCHISFFVCEGDNFACQERGPWPTSPEFPARWPDCSVRAAPSGSFGLCLCLSSRWTGRLRWSRLPGLLGTIRRSQPFLGVSFARKLASWHRGVLLEDPP
jgi:hypothetical protein